MRSRVYRPGTYFSGYPTLYRGNPLTEKVLLWVWGQSNSTTYQEVAELTDQSFNTTYSNVRMMAMQSHDATPTWVQSPAQDLGPISDFQPGTGPKIGLSSSLGRDMDSARPRGFAVVHTGAWGTDSAFWDANFADMIAYVQSAMVELDCTSIVMVCKHGEEDSKTQVKADAYDTWFAGFLANVRSTLGSVGPGGGEVPCVVGQLSATSTYGAFTTNLRTSINNLPGLCTTLSVVDLDSVALSGDATHFTADGLIAIGHLYAGAVADVLGVHIPPVADWSASVAALQVTFTDESLSPSDPITTYAWTFGDGNVSALQSPVHTYAESGTYAVELTVTNSAGRSDSLSSDVTVAGLAVTSDATSGAYLPQTSAEWTDMLADIGNGMSAPFEFWLPGGVTSGNMPGVNGLVIMNAKNTPLYQQSVTNWATKAVGWADGTTKGFDSTDADLPDMGTEDVLVLAYVAVTAPISTRNIIHLGTPSANRASVDALSTSNLRVFQGGTATNGSGAVGSYTGVRAILFKVDRTNSTCRLYTDLEKLSPVWDADMLGKAFAIGAGPSGGSPLASAPSHYLYLAIWKGADARITDAQAKSLITGLGNGLWTPPWT